MPRKDSGQTKRLKYRRQIAHFMEQDLPTISQQRAKPYRPTVGQARYYFRLLNHVIFHDRLSTSLIVVRRLHGAWGLCKGLHDLSCEIHLTDRYYCRQWFLTVLAHEMCHQYQWQVLSTSRQRKGQMPIMSHGPSFFLFRDHLRRYGIPLKTAVSQSSWFRHQNLFKA